MTAQELAEAQWLLGLFKIPFEDPFDMDMSVLEYLRDQSPAELKVVTIPPHSAWMLGSSETLPVIALLDESGKQGIRMARFNATDLGWWIIMGPPGANADLKKVKEVILFFKRYYR